MGWPILETMTMILSSEERGEDELITSAKVVFFRFEYNITC